MSKPKDGGPAFPVPMVAPAGDYFEVTHTGMSLRNYFAAKIAQGDAAASEGDEGGWGTAASDDRIRERVKLYYRIADAMLAHSKGR